MESGAIAVYSLKKKYTGTELDRVIKKLNGFCKNWRSEGNTMKKKWSAKLEPLLEL